MEKKACPLAFRKAIDFDAYPITGHFTKTSKIFVDSLQLLFLCMHSHHEEIMTILSLPFQYLYFLFSFLILLHWLQFLAITAGILVLFLTSMRIPCCGSPLESLSIAFDR